MDDPIRLGTRASPLALAQAHMAAAALCSAHGWPRDAVAIMPMTTTGDRVLDRPLYEVGGKALFTRELDRALLERRIDFAVHSMKDVETFLPEGVAIAAVLPRADPTDRLIGAAGLDALPPRARLGTSSPRRAAQALHLRPDLAIVPFRGNVATRIAKLEAGEAEATLLAAAGLDRLGEPHTGVALDPEIMLPAPAQGAVAITVREDDARMAALIAAIDHGPSAHAVRTERAVLAALGGSCRTPIAALALIDGGRVRLRAEILSEDGRERRHGERLSGLDDSEAAARDLAHALLGAASPGLRAKFEGAA